MNRREMILGMVGAAGAAHGEPAKPAPRLLFTSAGKTCIIGADGRGFGSIEVSAPNQVTWQPCGFFRDGRILLLSMEQRRDGPGRPFEEYYTQTPTHIWSYDPGTRQLTELATKGRMAPFETPQLLLNDQRMLVQVVRNRVGQIFNMALDGSDAREFTGAGDGFPYGLSASPDGERVAFHLAGGEGYQVWTSGTDGTRRARVAAARGHLYFGTAWSPDGRWVLYVDCLEGADPGHDWADVCVGKPDGSQHRVLTQGQAMWFAATYGAPGSRGGGSNVPTWMPDGSILFPRRIPGSRVAWEYQAGRPDLDHFNREYKPDQARGGTCVCRLDPRTGTTKDLTPAVEGRWDFRCTPSPDGRLIAFCRCVTGEVPSLWVMNADGSKPRRLTRGLADAGADHPRWMRMRAS